jgi:hypothetical protein
LLAKPEKVNSLYIEEVEKAPDFSNTHLIETFSLDKDITSRICDNSSHSFSSLGPKTLLKDRLGEHLPECGEQTNLADYICQRG